MPFFLSISWACSLKPHRSTAYKEGGGCLGWNPWIVSGGREGPSSSHANMEMSSPLRSWAGPRTMGEAPLEQLFILVGLWIRICFRKKTARSGSALRNNSWIRIRKNECGSTFYSPDIYNRPLRNFCLFMINRWQCSVSPLSLFPFGLLWFRRVGEVCLEHSHNFLGLLNTPLYHIPEQWTEWTQAFTDSINLIPCCRADIRQRLLFKFSPYVGSTPALITITFMK